MPALYDRHTLEPNADSTPENALKERRSFPNHELPRFWWLLPTSICLPTAVIASIATWPSKIERAIDFNFYFDQAQEMKELYIALFILLFVVSLYLRLLQLHRAGRLLSPL